MLDGLGSGAALVPEQDAATPLGQMLVERGYISPDQLDAGLDEQERSGLPLGQVLLSLGYVTASTLAQALATQSGSVLKTEYGFATGFDAEEQDGPVLEPPVSPDTPWADAAPDEALEADVIPFAPLQVAPPPVPVTPAPPVPELVVLPSFAETEAATRIASLELELAGAVEEAQRARQELELLRHESTVEPAHATDMELFAAHARVAELEVDNESTHLALDAANARSAALDAELANARLATADHSACAFQVQQLQSELAMSTENLRAAYQRLHQFEIAAALQQAHAQQMAAQQPVQQPPAVHAGRAASPFSWQN
jgi:hypothetical protein